MISSEQRWFTHSALGWPIPTWSLLLAWVGILVGSWFLVLLLGLHIGKETTQWGEEGANGNILHEVYE